MSETESNRHWLRYSLRTMLVVVLVLSVCFAHMANQEARQRRSVALTEQLGGRVFYDCEMYQTTASYSISGLHRRIAYGNPVSRPTGRLYDALGIDWFHHPEVVIFDDQELSDEQFTRVLDGLPRLKSIILIDCPITDGVLDSIASLSHLEMLHIENVDIIRGGIWALHERRPRILVHDGVRRWAP